MLLLGRVAYIKTRRSIDLITTLVKLNLFFSTTFPMQCTFQNSPTMHDHKILKENTCISDLPMLPDQRSCRVTGKIFRIFLKPDTL